MLRTRPWNCGSYWSSMGRGRAKGEGSDLLAKHQFLSVLGSAHADTINGSPWDDDPAIGFDNWRKCINGLERIQQGRIRALGRVEHVRAGGAAAAGGRAPHPGHPGVRPV